LDITLALAAAAVQALLEIMETMVVLQLVVLAELVHPLIRLGVLQLHLGKIQEELITMLAVVEVHQTMAIQQVLVA
jgi:hypothetical protein